MKTKTYISALAAFVAGAGLIATALVALPASAQTMPQGSAMPPMPMAGYHRNGMGNGSGMMIPGVMGTVTAVNGDSISVSGRQGFSSTTPAVTYTVNATNASVRKNNATSTVSAIDVGDTIFARGTISGDNVTATMIVDGMMGMGMHRGPGMRGGMNMASSSRPVMTSPITGNGEPVIAGSVTNINGSTITITNKSGVSYTVDVSNAKLVEGQATIALSNISVGDALIVQGTVNGSAVTASSVIDQGQGASATAPSVANAPHKTGIFGAIGQFFSHIFGF